MWKQPLPQLNDDLEEKEKDRTITLSHLGHQLDIRTRKAVSSILSHSKSGELAKRLNKLRKEYLQDFRDGKIDGQESLDSLEHRFISLCKEENQG